MRADVPEVQTLASPVVARCSELVRSALGLPAGAELEAHCEVFEGRADASPDWLDQKGFEAAVRAAAAGQRGLCTLDLTLKQFVDFEYGRYELIRRDLAACPLPAGAARQNAPMHAQSAGTLSSAFC